MSERISRSLRKTVVERARRRCEYCLIYQTFSAYSHEVDHVIALKHGGKSLPDNLVFCLPCNRHKGSDIASFDPLSGAMTPLFNPRIQLWPEHLILKWASFWG